MNLIASFLIGAIGCLGLAFIGYCAGWADCERAINKAKGEQE